MLAIITVLIFLFNLTLNGINADAKLRIAFLPFANLTNQFLRTVQPNDGLKIIQKYILSLANSPSDPQSIINDLWLTYLGYIILVILGLLFIIFFTLVGLCFCCCRCRNKCGAKPPGPSENNAKIRRIVYNILLILFTSMILIGGIISMASNVILLDAIKRPNETSDPSGNIFSNINTTIDYAISYVNYIANNGLSKGNSVLNSTIQNLINLLSNVITVFTNTFFTQLNFDSLMMATDFIINAYTNLTIQAQNLSTISSLHRSKTALFIQYLQTVNKNLSNILQDKACQNFTDNCQQLNSSLVYLVLGFNVSNINYTVDINAQNVVGTFNVSDLQNAKYKVLNSSVDISDKLNTTINGYIQDFSKALSANSSIYQTYNNVFGLKDTIINYTNIFKDKIYNFKFQNSKSFQENLVYEYYKWVFYGFIFLISIILLIVLLFFVGLCFGICGGPNFEDSSCCSKGAGSKYFMGSAVISFLFGWLIMLIVTVMFIIGGPMQTEVCSYLTPQAPPSYIQTMDNIINALIIQFKVSIPLNNSTITIPNINLMQSLMTRCPVSVNLISAFNISISYMNSISNIIYQQLISPTMVTLVQKIYNYSVPNIIVNPILNSTNSIISIINQLTSYNTAPTVTELNNPVTKIADITGFIELVNSLSKIANNSNPQFSSDLLVTISNLSTTVTDMTTIHSSYSAQKSSFISLYKNIVNPLQTLTNTISLLPSKTSDAKAAAFIAANATLISNTTSLVNDTIFKIVLSLGNCQGLSTTFFSAVSTVCTTLLVPLNNLWMGMGWFLLFIIPSIIVSLKLHRIFRITHIENNTSRRNKAYQTSNNFLSENDMAMIRSGKNESFA